MDRLCRKSLVHYDVTSIFCGGGKIQTIVLNGNEASLNTSQFYQPCVFFSVVPSNGEHRVIRPIAERTPELSMSNPHDQKS
jgi:hypothetical protein